MKYGLLLMLIPSLLLGCDQNKTTVITNSPPVTPEQSQENQDKTLIEYLWLSTGPDFTEARLTELAATWNDLIDAGAYDVITANILRPQFESENFDLVWVLLWSSEVARDNKNVKDKNVKDKNVKDPRGEIKKKEKIGKHNFGKKKNLI